MANICSINRAVTQVVISAHDCAELFPGYKTVLIAGQQRHSSTPSGTMKHCWYLLEQCEDRGNCFEVNALIQFTGSQGIRQVITKKLTILKTYREIKHISNQLKKGEFKNKHYPIELLWPRAALFITKGIRSGRRAELPHHGKKINMLLGKQINTQSGQHVTPRYATRSKASERTRRCDQCLAFACTRDDALVDACANCTATGIKLRPRPGA